MSIVYADSPLAEGACCSKQTKQAIDCLKELMFMQKELNKVLTDCDGLRDLLRETRSFVEFFASELHDEEGVNLLTRMDAALNK